jgi:hypothetical protein
MSVACLLTWLGSGAAHSSLAPSTQLHLCKTHDARPHAERLSPLCLDRVVAVSGNIRRAATNLSDLQVIHKSSLPCLDSSCEKRRRRAARGSIAESLRSIGGGVPAILRGLTRKDMPPVNKIANSLCSVIVPRLASHKLSSPPPRASWYYPKLGPPVLPRKAKFRLNRNPHSAGTPPAKYL